MLTADIAKTQGTMTIYGVSWDQIKQSVNLIGKPIEIWGGMRPGLPLATKQSALRGRLFSGRIFRCWGNWIGTRRGRLETRGERRCAAHIRARGVLLDPGDKMLRVPWPAHPTGRPRSAYPRKPAARREVRTGDRSGKTGRKSDREENRRAADAAARVAGTILGPWIDR